MDGEDCQCSSSRAPRAAGLGTVDYKSNSTYQQGAGYYNDGAAIADTNYESWSSSGIVAPGGLTLASDADLLERLAEDVALSAAEQERKEDAFRKEAQELVTTVSKYCLPCAPFAAAAYLFLEGAMAFADLFDGDANAEEYVERVKAAVTKYAALGIVAPAFNPEFTLGARGYAELIERGLGYAGQLNAEQQGAIARLGELIKKHGARPIVFTHTDKASRSMEGMLGPGMNVVNPWNVDIVAGAVAVEYNLAKDPLRAVVAAQMERTRREEPVDDGASHTRQVANGMIAALEHARTHAVQTIYLKPGVAPTPPVKAIDAAAIAMARRALYGDEVAGGPGVSAGVALRTTAARARTTNPAEAPSNARGLTFAAAGAALLAAAVYAARRIT